ncbi:hypothetical protein IAT38_001418 [Cryptococcus sp. DSM 104549]
MPVKMKKTTAVAATAAAASLPRALASTPAARWGHQAVYVKSKQAVYVVGGEVSSSDSEITNEVLILSLNSTSTDFTSGSSSGLPAHAFASMIVTPDDSSLVVVGGMTSDCSSDATAHTLDLSSGTAWTSATPNRFSRRRGTGMVWVDNNSTNGEVMVVGGIADSYSCASSTSVYAAADILSLPLSSSALVSSRSLPTSLTGSTLAVSDFGLATDSAGKIYLAGGQSSSGDLVSLSAIGVWDSSNGWKSQSTTGDVPAGRIGASLVAHPSLDLLVLHGGSISNSTTGGTTPTSLLSLLNTTSWEWSAPSSLQPAASSAASYHSAVMTDQGVMISAFGLSASNTPRSDVNYLDLRDPTQTGWVWSDEWSSSMLGAYSSSGTTSGTAGGVTASDTETSSGMSSKKLAAIIVPVLLVALLLAPVVVYLVRRRMRLVKKRRMARHFSFSSQEDEGSFTSPFDQYLAKRRTKTQFGFGRDANERESAGMAAGVAGTLGRIVSRLSNRSSDEGHVNTAGIGAGEEDARQMTQVPRTLAATLDSQQPMNWEEIDFGLGKLDESKIDPTHNTNDSDRPLVQIGESDAGLAAPVAVGAGAEQGYSPEQMYAPEQWTGPAQHVYNGERVEGLGSPMNDGQAPLVPSLAVLPTTRGNSMNGKAASSDLASYPAMEPTPAYTARAADGSDWVQLQKDLSTKPAFHSLSPTAQIRSHAHPSSSPSSPTGPAQSHANTLSALTRPRTPSHPPTLPPLEFGRSQSPGGTITLVNPTTGAQTSETLPFSGLRNSPSPQRSVSQPFSRQLAGRVARRGSAPGSGPNSAANTPHMSPMMTQQGAAPKARAVSASFVPQQQPQGLSPVQAGRRVSAGSVKFPSASRRGTQLRVVNVTEGEEDE